MLIRQDPAHYTATHLSNLVTNGIFSTHQPLLRMGNYVWATAAGADLFPVIQLCRSLGMDTCKDPNIEGKGTWNDLFAGRSKPLPVIIFVVRSFFNVEQN